MREDVIVLRGHHLLCIQGFRGYGYSEQFVARMSAVVRRLKQMPITMVELADNGDDICLCCPHLIDGVCKKSEEESEAETAARDRRVLSRLNLQIGRRITWAEILDIMRARITPTDLPGLCHECQWSSYGYCEEGLKSLLSNTNEAV